MAAQWREAFSKGVSPRATSRCTRRTSPAAQADVDSRAADWLDQAQTCARDRGVHPVRRAAPFLEVIIVTRMPASTDGRDRGSPDAMMHWGFHSHAWLASGAGRRLTSPGCSDLALARRRGAANQRSGKGANSCPTPGPRHSPRRPSPTRRGVSGSGSVYFVRRSAGDCGAAPRSRGAQVCLDERMACRRAQLCMLLPGPKRCNCNLSRLETAWRARRPCRRARFILPAVPCCSGCRGAMRACAVPQSRACCSTGGRGRRASYKPLPKIGTSRMCRPMPFALAVAHSSHCSSRASVSGRADRRGCSRPASAWHTPSTRNGATAVRIDVPGGRWPGAGAVGRATRRRGAVRVDSTGAASTCFTQGGAGRSAARMRCWPTSRSTWVQQSGWLTAAVRGRARASRRRSPGPGSSCCSSWVTDGLEPAVAVAPEVAAALATARRPGHPSCRPSSSSLSVRHTSNASRTRRKLPALAAITAAVE